MRPQNKHLTPFQKGCANPRGSSPNFQRRFDELSAELEASGIPLTARERIDLSLAVDLSLKRTKSVHDKAQAASTYRRLVDPLFARRKASAQPRETLRDRLLREQRERELAEAGLGSV